MVHHWHASGNRVFLRHTQAFLKAIRFSPIAIILPIAILGVCVGLGVWGVLEAAESEKADHMASASDDVALKAAAVEKQLQCTIMPTRVGAC